MPEETPALDFDRVSCRFALELADECQPRSVLLTSSRGARTALKDTSVQLNLFHRRHVISSPIGMMAVYKEPYRREMRPKQEKDSDKRAPTQSTKHRIP
jgi:hypothetical protein